MLQTAHKEREEEEEKRISFGREHVYNSGRESDFPPPPVFFWGGEESGIGRKRREIFGIFLSILLLRLLCN